MTARFLAIALILVSGSFAYGAPSRADEKVELQGGGGAQDLLNMKKIPTELSTSNRLQMKVSLSCTDSKGKVVQKGDAGYDLCMAEKQREAAQKGQLTNPSAASPGATLHLGN